MRILGAFDNGMDGICDDVDDCFGTIDGDAESPQLALVPYTSVDVQD